MVVVDKYLVNVFRVALYALLLAVVSACVPSVSAVWKWQVKSADELAAQGMQLTTLMGDLQYEPNNSASEFKDIYERGGRGFESVRNRKVTVGIFLDSGNNNISIKISENFADTLSQSGYEHYVVLKNALNAKFGEGNIKHTVYHSSFKHRKIDESTE